ncbi:MAG: hypothetical protein VZQ80_12035, partial [Lachnospiraceae bacterium]|nr:hypothetical protein [Lachnospiraceae bacterium]
MTAADTDFSFRACAGKGVKDISRALHIASEKKSGDGLKAIKTETGSGSCLYRQTSGFFTAACADIPVLSLECPGSAGCR